MLEPDPSTYQVALPLFEGPLDLLLHLIEREELDITQVSLAQVTGQYLDHLARLCERNPDNLADFVVVAAKLLLIKSRALLPQPSSAAALQEAEEDEGEDLIRQLLEYKRFKEAARKLAEIEAQGLRAYVRVAAAPHLDAALDLSDVTLDQLVTAVREVLAVKPAAPSVNGSLPPVRISVVEQIERIERETSHGRSVSFRWLLEGATSRMEIIVTLLAVLEMIKQLRVIARQDRLFGDVVIVGLPSAG